MSRCVLGSLGVVLVVAGSLPSQTVQAPAAPVVWRTASGTPVDPSVARVSSTLPTVPSLSSASCGSPCCQAPAPACSPCGATEKVWFSSEYLLWWVRRGPLAVPLVTTGDLALSPRSGALGQPGTVPLFGGEGLGFGTFSGMRATLGGWIGDDQVFGIEGRGFLLERRSVAFSANSDAAGNPSIFLPAHNAFQNLEDRLIVSDAGRGFSGGVHVQGTTRLWGAEFNGVLNVLRDESIDIDVLLGFRYLDLDEKLALVNNTTDLILGGITTLRDRFDTRNQFYGGQLGARAQVRRGGLVASVSARCALGPTHQVSGISGDISPPTVGAPVLAPGGFFTQSSNIGRWSREQFTVVPEAACRVGYEILPGATIFAGYDFIYWSNVLRPGNQMDRSLNLTQNGVLGIGRLIGESRPRPLIEGSDFWAHGVSFGIDLRF